MAPDVGGWLTTIVSYLGGLWITIIVILFGVIAAWIGLYYRRRRRLNKPVIEMFDLGNGRFDFTITVGGWFAQHLTLGGLWDYGKEQLFRLKDKTPIYDLSHNDYVRINGRNGIIVMRNPNDTKFAIPISKFWPGGIEQVKLDDGSVVLRRKKLSSTDLFAEIAPVDLRNAAQSSMDTTETEMKTQLEKWMPIIALGTIAIVLVLITIFNTQYGNHMVDSAKQTLLEATRIQCTNAANTVPASAAAP